MEEVSCYFLWERLASLEDVIVEVLVFGEFQYYVKSLLYLSAFVDVYAILFIT